MRLYVRLRRRGAALRQYKVCLDVLQRELGLEPEPRTRRLYQAILRRRTAPLSDAGTGVTPQLRDGLTGPDTLTTAGRSLAAPLSYLPAAPLLVGREPELARLAAVLADVRAGRGRLVTVVGEAGVGKSRLLAEVAAAAERAGTRVLLGRAWEPEQILPFAPWVEAFRGARIADDRPLLDGLLPVWRGGWPASYPRWGPRLRRRTPPITGASSRRSGHSSLGWADVSRSSSSWRTCTGPTR